MKVFKAKNSIKLENKTEYLTKKLALDRFVRCTRDMQAQGYLDQKSWEFYREKSLKAFFKVLPKFYDNSKEFKQMTERAILFNDQKTLRRHFVFWLIYFFNESKQTARLRVNNCQLYNLIE